MKYPQKEYKHMRIIVINATNNIIYLNNSITYLTQVLDCPVTNGTGNVNSYQII